MRVCPVMLKRVTMKQDIHPKLIDVDVTCACGNVIRTKSTHNYSIEVCNSCHPVFNGDSSRLMVDTEGRVERFKRRYAARQEAANKSTSPKSAE